MKRKQMKSWKINRWSQFMNHIRTLGRWLGLNCSQSGMSWWPSRHDWLTGSFGPAFADVCFVSTFTIQQSSMQSHLSMHQAHGYQWQSAIHCHLSRGCNASPWPWVVPLLGQWTSTSYIKHPSSRRLPHTSPQPNLPFFLCHGRSYASTPPCPPPRMNCLSHTTQTKQDFLAKASY